MNKVKSAIITAIVVAAIVVAAVFGVASFNIGVADRYNSIAANIPLGSEFSGYVYTNVYPEGVLSADDYAALDDEDKASYEARGGLYVSLEESGFESYEELAAAVESDASVVAARLGDRGLTDFEVTVTDGAAIVAAVPSRYTYAAYKGDSSTDHSNALSVAASTLSMLLADGELTLRTTDGSITVDEDAGTTYDTTRFADEYTDADILGDGSATYPFVSSNEDVASYFSSVSAFTFGGSHVLTLNLSEEGREAIHTISTYAASSSSQTMYLCIGDTQILSIPCSATIDTDVMQYTMSTHDAAMDAASVLNSVVSGSQLEVDYQPLVSVLSGTARGGENAALLAFIGCIVVLAAVCVAFVIKYKKLGGVLAMSCVILALVLLYALNILAIQTGIAVLVTCGLALVLFGAANLWLLAEVRAQCKTGKTMQAAVKAAYKRVLLPVVDIHAVVLVAAILVAAVCAGEAAACGLILVVGTIASYALWWFTRLMWFVCSAPVRNKFAFGGFKREVYGDE